jgi:hypothetical protein
MHHKLSLANVALRGIVEASIVATFALWGYTVGGGTTTRLILAVVAPAVVFGFWGTVDFRFAGRRAELFRLLQELVVTMLAGAALFTVGHQTLGWLLLVVSLVHHGAVYFLGERLLKPVVLGPAVGVGKNHHFGADSFDLGTSGNSPIRPARR